MTVYVKEPIHMQDGSILCNGDHICETCLLLVEKIGISLDTAYVPHLQLCSLCYDCRSRMIYNGEYAYETDSIDHQKDLQDLE